MIVALTGVSGFIGSVIARHLCEHGHSVRGLVRSTSRRDHVEPYVAQFVEGAQDDPDAQDQLLDGADCAIHNSVDWPSLKQQDLSAHLQSNLVGTINFIEKANPRKFVFISTIAVHHDMRPRWGGRVDEDHPTRPGTFYGSYKAAVEAHLWAAHAARNQSFAAIRPCAVYGIDPNFERSIGHPIVKRIRERGRFDRLGGGKFVHVDDVAALTAATVEREDVKSGVFNAADCYARWADWAQIAAEELGAADARIDMSSPPGPKNVFAKHAVQALGIGMDRGFDGIRAHVRDLIDRMG